MAVDIETIWADVETIQIDSMTVSEYTAFVLETILLSAA
jgi:hypothetical protein